MKMSSMTASNVIANRGRIEQSAAKPADVHCPPMTHQNSGDHGHEMYPQQFVRLVGCHAVSAPSLGKRQDEKLH
ncbi:MULTISPECIES: hypothetical protein [unclassified Bradyrhizobium]|uniref:hypothetical protein n=1 Tax=unclassified Bradyrhizobium TaxID=2631580 RepID=UPI001FF8C997|nr:MULTISPECIES: hypothetical protein [unclassified Bradyrhizobium]MCK1711942.1 hypothetical protein [Bradyrhizobium sp. 143]MCK1727234.1 hypothetical protein [Bradyrhizobium sp. 142]MDE5441588.1 hypothetical protein [Bradyrhizobium sp. CSA207]